MSVPHVSSSRVGGQRRRHENSALLIPGLLVLGLGFLIPLVLLLPDSLKADGFGLDAYLRLFSESVYLRIVGNTARLGLIAAVTCLIFGYPLALWISRLGPRAKVLALVAVILPFWVSILVRTYSWIVILGQEGVLNKSLIKIGIIGEPISFLYRELGVMIGTINILAPFFILPMVATMSSIDQRLTDAALSLGATRTQAFWRVYFPLTLPSLISSFFLIFILTLGFYVTPAILGGGRVPMLATLLEYLVSVAVDWPLAAALSFFLLFATLVLFLVAALLAKLSRINRWTVKNG